MTSFGVAAAQPRGRARSLSLSAAGGACPFGCLVVRIPAWFSEGGG
eukprot:CAMPEP_0204352830 /NCGR_PEP_ID=MMETSP0469-20131031/32189_1 /ASSEMBLY_ACC=CAM_ASM_000384 /TAXON_ID=2969 /ORGANISM="Oxyrrhis marina" /LENGTH=45 /DNA_ID= /DNA_START= /DNA_END= /DNA_ORIENTATION=